MSFARPFYYYLQKKKKEDLRYLKQISWIFFNDTHKYEVVSRRSLAGFLCLQVHYLKKNYHPTHQPICHFKNDWRKKQFSL